MYIRNTTFTYDPAQEEKVLRIIDDQLIPAFQQLPGFVSYASGLDRAARRVCDSLGQHGTCCWL